MLHADVRMVDIDVDHWRNLQSLLLESAKSRRRIVLIHEDGRAVKLAHSEGSEVEGRIERVDRPVEVAERLLRDNKGTADLVVVLERGAVDRYFAAVQDSWDPDEDVDEYVHRMQVTLDDYPDGLVTAPGPARDQLGLQWRVGATYEQVTAAVERFVEPDSTMVVGVFRDGALWSSLVLGFDADRRVSLVTTADPDDLGADTDRHGLLAWVGDRHPAPSLGLFADEADARELLRRRDKLEAARELTAGDRLVVEPLPDALARALAST